MIVGVVFSLLLLVDQKIKSSSTYFSNLKIKGLTQSVDRGNIWVWFLLYKIGEFSETYNGYHLKKYVYKIKNIRSRIY